MLCAVIEAGLGAAVTTILSFAAEHGVKNSDLIWRETIKMALQKGHESAFEALGLAEPSVATFNIGHSAAPPQYTLDRAIFLCNYEPVTVILKLIAKQDTEDPSHKAEERFGPGTYFVAAMMGTRIMEMMLQYGVPIAGSLHGAAKTGNLEVIALLLEHGADVNERLSSQVASSGKTACLVGWTTMHCAPARGQKEEMDLLESKGGLKDVLDSCGKTPLQLLRDGDPFHQRNRT